MARHSSRRIRSLQSRPGAPASVVLETLARLETLLEALLEAGLEALMASSAALAERTAM